MKTPISIIRQTFAITALAVLILSVNAGCGGGGDGEVVDIPATVPDVLNYEMSQGTGIFLNLNQGGDVTVTSTRLTGIFNRITQAFTLNIQPEAMAVSADILLPDLDTELSIDIGEAVDFSDYSLHVTSDVAWVSDDYPTSGEFDIRDVPDPVRKITMRVNPDADGQGTPGIDIILVPASSPSQSISMTWVKFESVLDDPTAEPYARIAAFAHSLLRFMYDQGGLVIQALELISENDTLLEETGTVEQSCDTYYPLSPSSTPAVSYDPGLLRVKWYDVNNDIGLGPGDTVYLDFIECWDNDETDTIDTFYNGTINLLNYTEVENAGVLTRIGFEPSASADGGIDYDYFKITETVTNSSNVIIDFSETITLTGGFSMVFTSP